MSDDINKMFSTIAENYDKMNHKMSFGKDIGWRRHTAKVCVSGKKRLNVLDVATGTGDLAIAINDEAVKTGKDAKIIGLDFNGDMLRIANRKIRSLGIKNIRFIEGDALSTQLKSNSFDVITSGFALRNFDDLQQFLQESYRLLKIDGKIAFLDVARPDSTLSGIMKLYYFNVIPALGAKYNKNAYVWLVSSLWRFSKDELVKLAKNAGFSEVKVTNLTLGAAFILTATKKKAK